MIIENQDVRVYFRSLNDQEKAHYESRAIGFEKNHILVSVKDLLDNSSAKVNLTCDYCSSILQRGFKYVILDKKHCCSKCIYLKVKENNLEKYGVENPGQMKHVREKVKQTMIEKYGVTNAYQIESVRQATLERYGVEFPFQSEEIREKQKQTMLEEYGVENPTQCTEIYDRVKSTMLERYGFEYAAQNKEIQEKMIINMLKTMYENGTVQTSRQQKHLHDLLDGKLNYPIDICSLDIAFPEENIYIEYNGGGHYAWPKFNGVSEEQLNRKEMLRYHYLKNQGWKLIRIVCKKDKLYSDDKIVELINDCKEYLLSGHSWIEIDMDLNKLTCSEYTKII